MDLVRMKNRFGMLFVAALLCFTFIFGNANRSCAYYGGSLYGGLYGGMSSLYGMGGMMGGLYGMSSPYGMGGLLGTSSLLGGLSSLNGLTGSLSSIVSTPAATTATVAAEQAGYWSGYYLSLLKLKGGFMTLNLVEDPITLDLSGPVLLALNQFKIPPVTVAGPNPGTGSFTLAGTYYDILNLITYVLQFNCVMTSDTSMTGDYIIADQLYTKLDYGTFNLTLGATILIPTTTLLPTTSLLPII